MENEIDISEGYLIHAVFVVGFGLAMIYFNWFIAFFILLFGITLLFVKTGVVFDLDRNKVKPYRSFFGLKIGIIRNISDFKDVKLKYTNETSSMFSQGLARDIQARTYDIILTKSNHQTIILHEFTDYKLAEQVYNIFVEKLEYKGTNLIVEIQKAIIKRRKAESRR